MDANLTAEEAEQQVPSFPYANWGPKAAVLGTILAIGTGLIIGALLALPVIIADGSSADGGDIPDAANSLAQLGAAIGFLMVSIVIAADRGAPLVEALRKLGLRRFRPSAFLWMAASIGAYLLIAIVYSLLAGEPEQQDIAEDFGAVPVQILLIVIAAPISEEVCFRGLLFGGLRARLPMVWAALLSGLIFGALHAVTGISAVPVLVAFGVILALLYEKTGSIVPGILLHMLNNGIALVALTSQ